MTLSIRRLGLGDEDILRLLAGEDEDFDLANRGAPHSPLVRDAAVEYLSDPQVLHWIAQRQEAVVGHLQCSVLRKRYGNGAEVLLYEIGVRSAHRRQGIGRALMEALRGWMEEHAIRESWVLADNPAAVEFYRACGFETVVPSPTYLARVSAPGRREPTSERR